MLKRSTVAHMRLALAVAAAGAAALSSSSLVGCGKEDLPTTTSQGRTPRTPDPNVKGLAGKPDAGPKPPPDPCPGCGMG